MNFSDTRPLLVASYSVLSINMLIEVIAHPDAKDHVGSITGLLFLAVILVALVLNKPPGLIFLATVLNMLNSLVCGFLILTYIHKNAVGWDAAKDLIVRTYFMILVPIFAIRYFAAQARLAKSSPQRRATES